VLQEDLPPAGTAAARAFLAVAIIDGHVLVQQFEITVIPCLYSNAVTVAGGPSRVTS
jgi:hypothetical protein